MITVKWRKKFIESRFAEVYGGRILRIRSPTQLVVRPRDVLQISRDTPGNFFPSIHAPEGSIVTFTYPIICSKMGSRPMALSASNTMYPGFDCPQPIGAMMIINMSDDPYVFSEFDDLASVHAVGPDNAMVPIEMVPTDN